MLNISITEFEVKIEIPVTEKNRFTIGKFYSEFLNIIGKYVQSYKKYTDKLLIFDFSEVEEIDPLVLPNMITLGIGLNKLHRSVTRIQNVHGAAAYMLSKTNFKQITELEKIYSFKDLENELSEKEKSNYRNCRIFLHYFKFPYKFKFYTEQNFENNDRCRNELVESIICELDEYENAEKIKMMINNESAMTNAEFKSYTEELDNEVINTIQPIGCERLVQTGIIFKCIFENIKNAYMHGLSGCAVMIFARPFPKLKKEKIEISISDVGKGIPYSISKKLHKSTFKDTNAFNLRDDLSVEDKAKYNFNYSCILESIFYRAKQLDKADDNNFGLFDVICSVLEDKDKNTKSDRRVYIHSDGVRLCLTNIFYEKYLKNCINRKNGKMDMSVAEAILSEKVYSFKEEYSYVKIMI